MREYRKRAKKGHIVGKGEKHKSNDRERVYSNEVIAQLTRSKDIEDYLNEKSKKPFDYQTTSFVGEKLKQ